MVGSTSMAEDESFQADDGCLEDQRQSLCSGVGASVDIETGEAEQRQCRICLETDGDDLIAPCSCKGSAKYVHRDCLDQWRSTKEGAAFSQCTTCKARYSLRVQPPKLTARATKFLFLVTRDTFAICALSQLCVGLYALATYGLDVVAQGSLRKSCGFERSPAFYYLFGLFIFLFVAGILGRQVARAQREQQTIVILTLRRRSRRPRHPRAQLALPLPPPLALPRLDGQGSGFVAPGALWPRGDLQGSGAVLGHHAFPHGVGNPGEAVQLRVLGEGGHHGGARQVQRAEDAADVGDVSAGMLGHVAANGEPSFLEQRPRAIVNPHALGEESEEQEEEEEEELVALDELETDDPSEGLLAGTPSQQQQQQQRQRQQQRLSMRDRRVLLRFRHTVEITPEAMIAGSCVAFFVGFLCIGMMELGVALGHLDGFFVACLAAFSVPSGVLYWLKLLKTVWDSHRCILTKRMLTEEYVVVDLSHESSPPELPPDRQNELQSLGLW